MSKIAIVGAGYVGVPLARVFADAGQTVVLVDVQAHRVAQLNRGESYIEDVPSEVLKAHVDAGLVTATTDYDELTGADAILVALPTPLSAQRCCHFFSICSGKYFSSITLSTITLNTFSANHTKSSRVCFYYLISFAVWSRRSDGPHLRRGAEAAPLGRA